MTLSPDIISLLLTCAQVSIAFAGFAGVIGSFSRFRLDPRVISYRVRTMVGLGLTALVFSLTPFAPAVLGASTGVVWQVSCAFAAAVSAVLYAVLLWQVLPLFRDRILHTQAINVVWYLVSAILIIANAAVAAGFFSAHSAGVFINTLFFILMLCIYNFMMLIISIQLDDKR